MDRYKEELEARIKKALPELKESEEGYLLHKVIEAAYIAGQKEQKPAGWSEKDKEMLEKCISHMINIIPVPGKHGLEDMSFEKHTDEELVIWFKSLPERFNLPPKQEWSEEDEKIRKWLIEMVEEVRKANPTNAEHNGNCSEAIAYLEKRKEQKLIDYPYVPGWRKNRDGNKPELKHSVLMLTTHGVAEGEWLGEKWCQYRWSCELKDNEILYWIHLSDLTQLEKEDEIIEKEQKPAEWSEEDARILYNVIAYVGYAAGQRGVRDDAFKEANSWLKSLPERFNPQPKQEWSEEDEKILKDCIDMPYSADFISRERKKDAIRWLKSLRPQPHWKPSDEQIDTLEAVVGMIHPTDTRYDAVFGLLEELKAL